VGRVLLVIDVQNGFTKIGNLASPRCREAIPRIVEIVEKQKGSGADLIFTADTHTRDDLEFEMFPPHCIEGTEENDVVEELAPFLGGATLVQKRRYSAFHGTDLDRILREKRPDEVTVVGVCTDICVLHTVSDLRNRDYKVRVLSAGVETFDGPDHPADDVNRWALGHMKGILGAEVA
jgi:nicotinamidase-related amidase